AVRQDALLLRVSLILRQGAGGAGGAVLWYAQFDRAHGSDLGSDNAIGNQEQMAARCVAALQEHLPRCLSLRAL
ncbi:MAG: hypothetical protein RR763_12410, partial [Massilia sp.]